MLPDLRIPIVFAWLCLPTLLVAGEVQIGQRTLTIPDDCTIELVAAPPLTEFPIFAEFDEQGRLWLGESSGVQDWNLPQGENQRDQWHRLVRLTDIDGDGHYDQRHVVAQYDMPVHGIARVNGMIYVSAPPCIYRLTDQDDDGTPENQEVWYRQTSKMSNCINDIRGPFLGPDGWLYYAKGGASQVEYGSSDEPQQTKTRHFFRRHPNGSLTESVMTGGMDNPVEMTFLPGGERIYTATNFQLLGQPRRDGVGHALIGALVPKDIADVFAFPWSTPRMYDHPLYQSGAVAVSGITYCQTGPWPGDVVFAEFSGRRVARLELQEQGGSFVATPHTVLACDDINFHPTDVIEEADGSLLVLDTGGWYLHCCPSSAFFVPEAKGCIYRIRSQSPELLSDPNGLKLAWDDATANDLASRLGDRRHAVRKRALHALAARGEQALEAIESTGGNVDARENAVWVASQIAGPRARARVRAGLKDDHARVRCAALNAISLHRDTDSVAELIEVLRNDPSMLARRLAAECLGRCQDVSAASALLGAYDWIPSDPAIDHALGLALIEVGDPTTTRAALTSANARTLRGALMALEQMSGGELTAAEVMPLLSAPTPEVREAAWWIVARHASDWQQDLASMLGQWFSDATLKPEFRDEIVGNLGRVARSGELQTWMATALTRSDISDPTKISLLQAMASQAGVSGVYEWHEACLAIIEQAGYSSALCQEAATCLASMPPLLTGRTQQTQARVEKLRQRIRTAAANPQASAQARLDLLRSLRNDLGPMQDTLFDFLIAHARADQLLSQRTLAAEVIAASEPTETQLDRLAVAISDFSASEIATVLPKFANCHDEALGATLVRTLSRTRETLAVNPFRIKIVVAGFGSRVQQQAEPLLDELAGADNRLLQRAERVLEMVSDASLERGHALFQHPKTACVQCHVAVLVGGNTGPSLRGLGQRRSEADIIESILFPSASLSQGFETWLVTTSDGSVKQGVLLRDTPEVVELGNASGSQRIARDEIESMKPSPVSIMPQGLDQSLSDQQLADLVAYLKSLDH